jgi:hypothetical protein
MLSLLRGLLGGGRVLLLLLLSLLLSLEVRFSWCRDEATSDGAGSSGGRRCSRIGLWRREYRELDVEQMSMRLDDQLRGFIIRQPIPTSINSIRLPARSVKLWKGVNSARPSFLSGRATSLGNTGCLDSAGCLVSMHKIWPDFTQDH